jgi:hypothetical protein
VPWLAVTGTSTWVAGRNLPTFGPGVYEVSEEMADIARRDAPTRVVVCDRRPTVISGHGEPPLTLDDLRFGVQTGVRFPPDDLPEPDEEEEPVEQRSVPDAYFCTYCPAAFPSEPPLRRHVKIEHMVNREPEPEPAPEPEEDEDAEERVEQAKPGELPPWERPGV